jgi:renalase
VLSLIADDGDRRGDGAPVLVAHTSAELARAHDVDPDGAVEPVLAAVGELLGVRTRPDWTHVHRWRYSAPADSRSEPFHLGADGIALAGDGWGHSKIQTAWRSGTELGRAVVARLSGD